MTRKSRREIEREIEQLSADETVGDMDLGELSMILLRAAYGNSSLTDKQIEVVEAEWEERVAGPSRGRRL